MYKIKYIYIPGVGIDKTHARTHTTLSVRWEAACVSE